MDGNKKGASQSTMQNRESDTPARPERVRKLKRLILALLVLVMILPMIASILMLIHIHRLNRQLDAMKDQVALLQQNREADALHAEDAVETQTDSQADAQMDMSIAADGKDGGNDAAETTQVDPEEMIDPGNDARQSVTEAKTTNPSENDAKVKSCKVYLTFDDGPSSNTGRILDLLAKYDVKATFFVNGREGPISESLYKRIVDEGHTLGMHSYTHKYDEIYESKQAFIKDLERLQDYLYEVTGVWPRFYRFPGGSSNEVSTVSMQELADYLKEQDIYYLDWNVASGDAMGTNLSAGALAQRVLGMIGEEETQVVLMHDAADKSATVDALAIILEELTKQDGVEILQVSEDMDFEPVQHLKSNE
ncbi:MAG: polysaccharide deacetylase [Lachnospiraceae bacterium]|nr:polysaccharide deacetylase [Lachnospiraceae bacterium]